MKNYDVIIVGSGIGGLCCASLLALQGKNVLVCEAHSKPGGVAHSFKHKGYTFESGPSLWSGLDSKNTYNPLGTILNLLNEEVHLYKYKGWKVLFPEASFDLEVGNLDFREKIKSIRGSGSLKEWDEFLLGLKPLSKIINEIPLIKSSPRDLDLFEIASLAFKLLPDIRNASKLTGSFGKIAEFHLKDPFLKNWVDLLSFLISGMSMHDTNTAAMATLFNEWFKPNSYLEYPKGGSESIVHALLKGLKKNGGDIFLSTRVKKVYFEDDLTKGILLENGSKILSKYVVLNCDRWSIEKILPENIYQRFNIKRQKTPKCDSFLHIHLGFDSTGLNNLPIHSIWVDKWERGITAERNIAVFSIPSVIDPSMAPLGKHVLHGYTPANEPWEIWKDIDPKSDYYKTLKEDRCSIFLDPLKKIIPDIENRIEVKMLGTPLTHKKFTNTYCGSYGPAISASKSLFPGSKTPIKNLFVCGASTFPGIGIPAVAASGAYAAEAILGKKEYKTIFKNH